jgi:hypothetical protein
MELYRSYQKMVVAGHDLVFRLLQFGHFAKLVGPGGLTLANDLRGRLEQAEQLAFRARLAAQDARPGLLHHLPD